MDYLHTLLARNEAFVAEGFNPGLRITPTSHSLIVGCVDTRVDPMAIFRLEQGEAAVYRNVGGRVNPALLETIALLRAVTRAAGGRVGTGSNLILMQHTDCGINHCYRGVPRLLAQHMGVAPGELDTLAVTNPYEAVALDVETLKQNLAIAGGYTVSGVVYDVATGKVTTVVPPVRLPAVEEAG